MYLRRAEQLKINTPHAVKQNQTFNLPEPTRAGTSRGQPKNRDHARFQPGNDAGTLVKG